MQGRLYSSFRRACAPASMTARLLYGFIYIYRAEQPRALANFRPICHDHTCAQRNVFL